MKKIILLCLMSFFLFSQAYGQEIKEERKTISYQGEESLSVKIQFGVGKVRIEKGEGKYILDADFKYSKEDFRPVVEYEYDKTNEHGRLLLKLERDKDEAEKEVETEDEWNWKVEENEWILRFTDRVPINFDIEIGASESEIDFTGMKVKDVFLDTGAGNVNVDFDEPNEQEMENMEINAGVTKLRMENLMNANIENLNFNGGVGQFTLDFDGELKRTSHADISLGVGQMTLMIPESVGTKIKTRSFFLSPFSADEFDKVESGMYQNEMFGKSDKELIIDLKGGLGSLNVETIEGK